MNAKRTIYLICTKTDARGHHAIAAQPQDPQKTMRRGDGETREEAIAKALHCGRVFYADPEAERDLIVAEVREQPTLWALRGHTIERLQEAA